MVSFREASRFVGQTVCVSCKGNRTYQGIVREVAPNGVLLEIPPGGPKPEQSEAGRIRAVTADKAGKVKGEPVFWLLPFAALFGIRGFGGYGAPYRGYGAPGFGYGHGYGFGIPPYRPFGFGYPGIFW